MNGGDTIVTKLDPKRAGEKLRAGLEATGAFAAHRNPNAHWAFRGEGVVVTLYRTGKCVVQGAGAEGFAERWLDGAEAPAASKLERLSEDLIGTDESGKGDYFGPLVTAAVLVPKGQEVVLQALGVRDSKALSDRQATEAAKAIRAGYPHEVVAIGPERYNEMYKSFGNLNPLLAWATAQAVEGIVKAHPCRSVLSDKFGNERLIADALKKKKIDVKLVQKVRAESNPAVAAASILARDAFLTGLARCGREVGTKLPKGAGAPVLAAARKLYQEGGREALAKVAKLHFKTTKQVTGELF